MPGAGVSNGDDDEVIGVGLLALPVFGPVTTTCGAPPTHPPVDPAAALCWLARTGDEFQLAEHPAPSHHLWLTVHDLDADETARLLDDLAEAALANRPPGR